MSPQIQSFQERSCCKSPPLAGVGLSQGMQGFPAIGSTGHTQSLTKTLQELLHVFIQQNMLHHFYIVKDSAFELAFILRTRHTENLTKILQAHF